MKPSASQRAPVAKRCTARAAVVALVGAWMCCQAPAAVAQIAPRDSSDLTGYSLEELMSIELITASRKATSLFFSPAAAYVLTSEDLRRSGATSIPEALRMVPGMQVARATSSQWAITARGFNNLFANKLLVLIDGRSVYTPLFGGVYWDVQDVPLENVERIEVVRGPGGALWGANAVNGIINIISKKSHAMSGGLLAAGGGDPERGFGTLRFGARAGRLQYAAWANGFDRGACATPDAWSKQGGLASRGAADDWKLARGGLRLDWGAGARDSMVLQAEGYGGTAGETATSRLPVEPFEITFDDYTHVSGGNVLACWNRAFSPSSHARLQAYGDGTHRRDVFLREDRFTFDVDLQQDFTWGGRQQIVWGLGSRYTRDDIEGSFTFDIDPGQRDDHLHSAFVHDEIAIVPARLMLTLGSKFEHNSYTGFETQPSARLLWTPGSSHSIWGAVSRAVRTPTRVENDVRFVQIAQRLSDSTLAFGTLFGNDDLEPDDLVAYELGYRVRPHASMFLDVASFYNVYDGLSTVELAGSFVSDVPPPAHRVFASHAENRGFGETWGVEAAASWEPHPRWRLSAGWSWLEMRLHRDPTSQDGNASAIENNNPKHQVQLRSYLNVTPRVSFDAALYRVGELPGLMLELGGQRVPLIAAVPAYTRLDLRLGWRASEHLELALAGQNLIDAKHAEFRDSAATSGHSTEIRRTVYGKAAWRF